MSYETPKKIRKHYEQKAHKFVGGKRNAVLITSSIAFVQNNSIEFNLTHKGKKSKWKVSNKNISFTVNWEF